MRQWRVIKCLCSEDNIAIGRLAERLRIKAPTLVGVLSRMSRNGLVTLVASRSDRRVKRVRLSSRGRGLCAVGTACEQRVEVEVLSGLSDVEVLQLLSVLQKICRNLQS